MKKILLNSLLLWGIGIGAAQGAQQASVAQQKSKEKWLAENAGGLRNAQGQYPLWLSLKYDREHEIAPSQADLERVKGRPATTSVSFQLGGSSKGEREVINQQSFKNPDQVDVLNISVVDDQVAQVELNALNEKFSRKKEGVLSAELTDPDKLLLVKKVYIGPGKNLQWTFSFATISLPDFILELPLLKEIRAPGRNSIVVITSKSLIKLIENRPDHTLKIDVMVDTDRLEELSKMLCQKKYQCTLAPVKDHISHLQCPGAGFAEGRKGPYGIAAYKSISKQAPIESEDSSYWD